MFHQGDIADAAYIILDGRADVVVDTADGPLKVAEVGSNAWSATSASCATCRAPRPSSPTENLTTLKITKDLFFRMVSDFPSISIEVMRVLAQRLEHATELLRDAAEPALSRLDSFIRRLEAQRACLDHAAQLIAGIPGNVLEFGLGNGRTYDHLRDRLRGRDIYVFDRQVAAHPDCIPPADRLFLGDFRDTLPKAIAQLGQDTALANLDIGSGDEDASKRLARAMLPFVLRLLKSGGILVSDQPVESADLEALALPAGVKPGRYFLQRRR